MDVLKGQRSRQKNGRLSMTYRITITANNVRTCFDFADPVNAVNFMTAAHKHASNASDDIPTITMTIIEEDF